MTYPLEGIKVLDMSRVLAGPFASRMLADLGADVVKVEPPQGDLTRRWGRQVNGQAGYFNQQNVGKRCLAVDLAKQAGMELIQKLAGCADVLLENFRPAVMENMELGWSVMQALNPRLIVCSVSGFGHGGPESDRPAYAPVIHAESGLLARQAKIAGGKLVDIPLPAADTNAALHGLAGILAALYMRERTGVGQHVDISMMDAMMITDDHLHYSLERSEDLSPMSSEVWETGMGPVVIAGDFRHVWRSLANAGQVRDPAHSEMSLEEKIRLRRQMVERYFAKFADRDAFVMAMDKAGLAWGFVRDGRDVREQPTVKARKSVVDIEDAWGKSRPVVQSPYRFSAAQSGIRGRSPRFGEHHAEVLGEWLGYDVETVRSLEKQQVLLTSMTPPMKPPAEAAREGVQGAPAVDVPDALHRGTGYSPEDNR